VVVAGDLVLDRFIYGRTDRISREAPVPIVRETGREVRPGGAANVVANLCALGVDVRVVGVVGDDGSGQTLRGLLEEAGARCRGLIVARGRPTEAKTRILAGGLSLTPQQVLRLDQGAGGPVDDRVTRRLGAALERALSGAGALAISDYGLGTCTVGLRRALRRARRRAFVAADARFDLEAYAGVHLVKPNAPELEAATGLPVRDARGAARAARRLASTLRLEAVLVTRGHEGLCLAPASGRALHLPPHGPPEAVDVTGAGDSVLAAFCAAVATGADLPAAARIANVAGGLAVQKPGTAVVGAEELAAALEVAT
jgi:rfaE bifunctional protein kinase chain/domain